MNFLDLLRTGRGVVSVVGSGGKTTLVLELARALSRRGATVVVGTTTHMLRPDGISFLEDPMQEDVEHELRWSSSAERPAVVAVGSCPAGRDEPSGKVGAPRRADFPELARVADFVLVEADGSKMLPLKAHESWEPVIAPRSRQVIQLVGASGFGRPVCTVAHRSEAFCSLAGCNPNDEATPLRVARVLAAEHASGRCPADVVVVNQAEGGDAMRDAASLSLALKELGDATPVVAGSVRSHLLRRV